MGEKSWITSQYLLSFSTTAEFHCSSSYFWRIWTKSTQGRRAKAAKAKQKHILVLWPLTRDPLTATFVSTFNAGRLDLMLWVDNPLKQTGHCSFFPFKRQSPHWDFCLRQSMTSLVFSLWHLLIHVNYLTSRVNAINPHLITSAFKYFLKLTINFIKRN